MSKRRKFRDDDLAIWHKVRATITPMQAVQPLKERSEELAIPLLKSNIRPLASPMPVTPKPAPVGIDFKKEFPVQDIHGLKRATKRDVSKGRMEPSAKLDLHGQRLDVAKHNFQKFIRRSIGDDHRVVLVVTGKGGYIRQNEHGNEVSGVIRRSFPDWINDPEIAKFVSHYTPAHIKHGGDGAWYVFLRNSARRVHKR